MNYQQKIALPLCQSCNAPVRRGLGSPIGGPCGYPVRAWSDSRAQLCWLAWRQSANRTRRRIPGFDHTVSQRIIQRRGSVKMMSLDPCHRPPALCQHSELCLYLRKQYVIDVAQCVLFQSAVLTVLSESREISGKSRH